MSQDYPSHVEHQMQIRFSIKDILELTPGAALVTNAGGRIVCANMRAERMFGYSHNELAGKALELLLPDRLRRRHSAHCAGYFHHLQRRPMGDGMEVLALRKDGTEFPVEITLSGLKVSEEVWALSMIRDVSEHKRGE
jgi:PAS domain S-box-containing protein